MKRIQITLPAAEVIFLYEDAKKLGCSRVEYLEDLIDCEMAVRPERQRDGSKLGRAAEKLQLTLTDRQADWLEDQAEYLGVTKGQYITMMLQQLQAEHERLKGKG